MSAVRLVSTVLVAAAAWLVLVYLLQRSVLFPARTAAGVAPPIARVGGEQVWLELPGGRVEAWFLPSRAPGGGPRPVLIFAHGNGELIDDWLYEFEDLRAAGLAILLVEYPGYGRSEGRPTEASVVEAMIAGYDWVVSRPGVDPDRIVAHGRSVGGGAACGLARKRRVAALVLESTFTSVRRMARRQAVPGFIIRDPFDNLTVLRSWTGPVLLLHGERDAIVPPSHAEELHRAAAGSELHLLPCGHNDCPRPWPLVRSFLAARGLL